MRRPGSTLRLAMACVAACVATAWAGGASGGAGAAATPQWLWIRPHAGDHQRVYFRRSFRWDGPGDHPDHALLRASADNHLKLFVNGDVVGASDSWDQPLKADVASRIHRGENVVAAEATNDGGVAAFVAELILTTKGQTVRRIVTDPRWVASEQQAPNWMNLGFEAKGWTPAVKVGLLGAGPWGNVFAPAAPDEPAHATDAAKLKLLPGFKAQLLYSVPGNQQGSWVAMCFDNKGRLIVSDQHGYLYRITLEGPGRDKLNIEPIEVSLELPPAKPGQPPRQVPFRPGAHGLCYAFDSLYVVVGDGGLPRGLYRVQDTNGDDQYDKVTLLRTFRGGGEHGPHSVVLSPDGKSLYICAGNFTDLPNPESSLLPRVWAEDQLLPRMHDASGFATTRMAPGSWICRTDPEGKRFTLVCAGFRNIFDFAFNHDGEILTYDSDMEWDIGLPWYRPTRLCHAIPGGDFGWRNGSGKFPPYDPDNLPPVVDIGPGSPTGMTFGYGLKFPAKYQNALYMNDWSYGNIFAVHLTPSGSTYKATFEKFVSGQPFDVTDIAAGPDGALYVMIGGRRTQSGLYRITYTGPDSTAPAPAPAEDSAAVKSRALRHELETYYTREDPKAIDLAWPLLGSPDRFLAYAARTAIEHQPVAQWQQRALTERDPRRSMGAILALARCGDKSLEPQMLTALDRIDPATLDAAGLLDLVRVYSVTFSRMGRPDAGQSSTVIAHFDPLLPGAAPDVNREVASLLVYLRAPDAVGKTVALLQKSQDPREQIGYAYILRAADGPWTLDQRKALFTWFNLAEGYRGGHSFQGYLRNMRKEVIAKLSDADKVALKSLLEVKPTGPAPFVQRPFVKAWTVEELLPAVESGMHGRNWARGRALFGEAMCSRCHTIAGEGGIGGPDLTAVGSRYDKRFILESILQPSKVISDQYQNQVFTLKNGSTVVGRIVNAQEGGYAVQPSLLAPDAQVFVKQNEIAKIDPSPVSPMPEGTIYSLHKNEVLDLIAYLISGGDRNNPVFQK